ncbi:hypothetical protein ACJX0J_028829, partial [Zea mays]
NHVALHLGDEVLCYTMYRRFLTFLMWFSWLILKKCLSPVLIYGFLLLKDIQASIFLKIDKIIRLNFNFAKKYIYLKLVNVDYVTSNLRKC